MKRRGELSIEVIIIAAIALLVLVILTILIIRNVGGGVNQGTSCQAVSGGQCVPDSCDDGYYRDFGHSCSTEGDVCCIPASDQE